MKRLAIDINKSIRGNHIFHLLEVDNLATNKIIIFKLFIEIYKYEI
ncbi:MAG: hypothetical protein ACI8WT_004812 [Clostridium sp.]|jgi:hypothetical protein